MGGLALGILGAFGLLILRAAANGLVLWIYWAWFVQSTNLTQINPGFVFFWAVGLALSLIYPAIHEIKSVEEATLVFLDYIIFLPALLIVAGFLLHFI